MTKQIFTCLFLSLFLLGACNDDEPLQLEEDITKIKSYLIENGLDAQAIETESGLHYVIEEEGTGDEFPVASSTVRVFYKGYLTCGTVFDQSSSVEPFETSLGGVIKGWTEGIPKFKKGGKGKLFIPSELGYGPSGTTGIRPNTVLIFDIELVSFF